MVRLGRKKTETRYPVVRLDEFDMAVHTDQQSLILDELIGSRKKMEQENQLLRERLEDAHMMIRLLKIKVEQLEKSKKLKGGSVTSGDTTVKGGQPGRYWKALDLSIEKIEEHPKRKSFLPKLSRKPNSSFANPMNDGGKKFVVPEHQRIVTKMDDIPTDESSSKDNSIDPQATTSRLDAIRKAAQKIRARSHSPMRRARDPPARTPTMGSLRGFSMKGRKGQKEVIVLDDVSTQYDAPGPGEHLQKNRRSQLPLALTQSTDVYYD